MGEIIYGKLKSTGKIVRISDIDSQNNGLKCGCVCPNCDTALQACALLQRNNKHKSKRRDSPRPYFRHYRPNNNCSAAKANESGLHKLAKQIIEEERKIALPQKEIPLFEFKKKYPADIQESLPEEYVVEKSRVLVCDTVQVEKDFGNFKTDVFISSGKSKYLIEIFVKHRKTEEDIEKYRKHELCYPVLEIDLSFLADKQISKEDLRSLICDETRSRIWIYYPNEVELKAQGQRMIEESALVREYCWEETKIKRMFDPETYSISLWDLKGKKNNPRGFTKDVFSEFSFYNNDIKGKRDELPFFVNIPISGEIIFECDRRVWQSYIFSRWIYNRKEDGAKTNIGKIFGDLEEIGMPINILLAKREINVPGVFHNKYLPEHVIRTYLTYLRNLGFIEIMSDESAQTTKRFSVDPPNQEYAQFLENAIERLGMESGAPNVDELISNSVKRQLDARKKEAMSVRREQKEREYITISTKEIGEADFNQEEHLICDSLGRFWKKCTSCGALKLEADMQMWGGKQGRNKGTCRECYLKLEKPPHTYGTGQPNKFRGR